LHYSEKIKLLKNQFLQHKIMWETVSNLKKLNIEFMMSYFKERLVLLSLKGLESKWERVNLVIKSSFEVNVINILFKIRKEQK
jgi:hypothetical protein